jgi:hypothetical protein
MFEINPVLKTSDNKILAVDAKVNLMKMVYSVIRIMLLCETPQKKIQLKLKPANII